MAAGSRGLRARERRDPSASLSAGGRGWRSWLPLAFVVLSLVALVVLPYLFQRRINELRGFITGVLDPADDAVDEVRLTVALEAATLRMLLLNGDTVYRERYNAVRREEQAALARVEALVPRVGSEAVRRLAELEAAMARRHALHEELFAGRISPTEYLEQTRTRSPLYLTTLEAANRLDHAVAARSAATFAQIRATERLGFVILLLVALLALTSALLFARLSLQLRRRAREERELRDAALTVTGATDVDEILRRIAESAVRASRAESSYVERIVPGTNEVEIVAAAGERAPPTGTRIRYPGSLTENVIRAGEPEILNDTTAQDRPATRILAEHCGPSAALVVPLIVDGAAHGALVLLGPASRPFRPRDTLQPRILGVLASLALRRAILLERLETSRRELAASEERRRRIYTESAFGIALGTLDGRILEANPAFQEMLGRSEEELRGLSFADITHPDDIEMDRALFDELVAGARRSYRIEKRYIRKDGQVIWGREAIWVLGDANGAPLHTVGLVEDVTERKRVEEERERLLTRLSGIVRTQDEIATAPADPESVMRLVVERARELTGAAGAMVGLPDGEELVYHVGSGNGQPFEGIRLRIDSSLSGESFRTGEVIRTDDAYADPRTDVESARKVGARSIILVPLRRGHEVIGILNLISPEPNAFTDEDVDTLRLMAGLIGATVARAEAFDAERRLVQERTEALERQQALTRAAQEAHAEAERRARQESALRQAVEVLSGSYTVEESIRIIAASALRTLDVVGAFVERLDLERGEVEVITTAGRRVPAEGTRIPARGSHAEWVLERGTPEIIPRLAGTDRPFHTEPARRCPDCSALALPLVDGGAAIGVLFLVREPGAPPFDADDVRHGTTFARLAVLGFHKVHLLEEAETARDEIRRLMQSRSRLMRGFSHDVKNPLSAADGYLQLLEEGVIDRPTAKQRESIARARRAIRNALTLIEDLLQLARTEVERIDLDLQPTDVRAVARETADEFRARAEAKGLILETAPAPEIPPIRSDATRIHQILGNLLSNAVKFTESGHILVRVEAREGNGTPHSGKWVAVDVEDTGPGISAEDQRKLFREFTRLHPGTEEGAGVGLASSQRIAHALGGTITLDSEPGRGSTFTLWLPRTTPGQNHP